MIMNKIILNFSVFFVFVSLFAKATDKVEKNVKAVEAVSKKTAEAIVLVNPLIDFIDGKSFGINANTFGLILQSRREVRKRLIGVVLGDKSKIGFYDFEGRKCFLSEFIVLEKQLASKGDAQSKAKYAELQKLLQVAKEDFIRFTSEYMDSAKGIKSALLGIIKEFNEKSGLGEFFLLGWVSVPDGGEADSVRANVKSFKDLQVLFVEMEGFLLAMANSCEKGKKLFIEMVNAAGKVNAVKA
jgi:hypothetical protein